MQDARKQGSRLLLPGYPQKATGYRRLLSVLAVLVLLSLLMGSLGHHLLQQHDHLDGHDCAICLEISRFESLLSRLFLLCSIFALLLSLCKKTQVILGQALVLPPLTPRALWVRLND